MLKIIFGSNPKNKLTEYDENNGKIFGQDQGPVLQYGTYFTIMFKEKSERT